MKVWYKKWWGILLIISITLILVVLVAFGFYTLYIIKGIKSGELTNQQLLINNFAEQKQYQAEGRDNYWLGSAQPKVTIVEFSDFACPFCKNSFPTIREISINYQDDVKIIYRDYPLREYSIELALAARCAGEQGLFWLMHDKLFQNQGISTNIELTNLANQIGADIARFNQCLASEKYLSQIQQDFTDGQNLGITGTPTWFINGVKVEGEIPYDLFIQLIEQLIQQ